ncbi:MAG: phosphocholine cytidylyltransferase family protein [Candidatus Omnitrophica bacterium]|nr:phosphocholine cytidylyltransferase family protein [Candidatus Omnitrophota bacterium]
MKTIIIAAGMGSRLNPLTNDKPKCMLEFKGKTLLEYQIDAIRGAGIDRIALIKGYKKEMINYPDLIYYTNDNYENNNILHSLFYAEKEMNDEFIAVYSDILYNKYVVKRLLDNKEDISIVVDIDWRGYYEGRTDHPIEEAENVIFDANNNVVKIGKILPDKNAVHGEFIGMMKCSKKGAAIFMQYFNRLKKIYSGKPFQRAPVFKKAYLTDIFQDMANNGVKINCVIIEKGWVEIDTIQDFERARKEFFNNRLNTTVENCKKVKNRF